MNKIKLQQAIWLCPVVNILQLISEFLWIKRESLTSYQERLRTKGKGVTASVVRWACNSLQITVQMS